MAISVMWITVASLVAAFDICKSVDENGNVIDTDLEYDCETLLRYVLVTSLVTCTSHAALL